MKNFPTPQDRKGTPRHAEAARHAWSKKLWPCLMALSFPSLYAQIPGSALDYMLQRPAFTKQFDGQSFTDHFFLEAGAGTNLTGASGTKPGGFVEAALGNWILPEHGVRLGLNAGLYHTNDVKSKFIGITADYLVNLTALAAPQYSTPRPFEIYGLAGGSFLTSRYEGQSHYTFGAHIGLRGQKQISSYTYFYVEPRVGVAGWEASMIHTWHKFRPDASLSAGFGFRRLPAAERREARGEAPAPTFKGAEGIFVSAAGGVNFFTGSPSGSWRTRRGPALSLGIGKWFDPYNALRITATASSLDQGASHPTLKAIGGRAEYMVNLHNVFGGYDPDRRFYINALAGGSVNYSTGGQGGHTTLGAGIGLQANAYIGGNMSLFVEPRIDGYQKDYASHLSTAGNVDLVTSLQAGLTYTYRRTPRKDDTRPADQFVQRSWFDHMFVEGNIGINAPLTRSVTDDPAGYLRPQAYGAVGKWFTALHGARLWAQAAQTEYASGKRYKHMAIGADYLFNFTNLVLGYRDYRPFELTGALGVNGAMRQSRNKMFFGMDASVKGLFRITPLFGLYLEPQLKAYNKNFLPTSIGSSGIDLIASLAVGAQIELKGYDRATAREQVEADGGLRSFISVAGGLAAQGNHLRTSSYYGPVGRISYTHWYTPLSAWRASLAGNTYKINGRRYAAATLGADYMTDLFAHTYGYNPDRPFTINALAGFNFGVDFTRKRTTFAPDFHAGGQFSVRLGEHVNAYLEPQLAYRLSKRFKDVRQSRWLPQVLLGVDYSFKRANTTDHSELSHERKNFVSAGIGTGAYTNTVNVMHPARRKFTLYTDAGYGRWLTGYHGVHLGLSNTVVQRNGRGNESLTALRAGYMMDMRAAITGERTDEKIFQLTGLAEATLTVGSRVGRKAQVVPGVQAALQAGWRATPSWEIYLEPSAAIFSSHILRGGSGHPVDGELRLSLGTKYNF